MIIHTFWSKGLPRQMLIASSLTGSWISSYALRSSQADVLLSMRSTAYLLQACVYLLFLLALLKITCYYKRGSTQRDSSAGRSIKAPAKHDASVATLTLGRPRVNIAFFSPILIRAEVLLLAQSNTAVFLDHTLDNVPPQVRGLCG